MSVSETPAQPVGIQRVAMIEDQQPRATKLEDACSASAY